MTPSQKKKSLSFVCMIHVLCACVPVCGHLWDSEDNLRCQSSLSITFETAPLFLLAVVHAWLAGPRASRDLLPHRRTGGVAEYTASSSFYIWAQGIWTHVFTLAQQVLYPLGHLFGPQKLLFQDWLFSHIVHDAFKLLVSWGFPILWISFVGQVGT